jgi:GTP cyclohydrolase I
LIIDENNNDIKLKEEYEKLKTDFDLLKNENKILKSLCEEKLIKIKDLIIIKYLNKKKILQ